jgi:signal transduction histidine kinase
MRERLEMVGGEFKVGSLSGRGTTVSVSVPISPVGPSPKKVP